MNHYSHEGSGYDHNNQKRRAMGHCGMEARRASLRVEPEYKCLRQESQDPAKVYVSLTDDFTAKRPGTKSIASGKEMLFHTNEEFRVAAEKFLTEIMEIALREFLKPSLCFFLFMRSKSAARPKLAQDSVHLGPSQSVLRASRKRRIRKTTLVCSRRMGQLIFVSLSIRYCRKSDSQLYDFSPY
jgi:hypothetical protein